MTSAAPLRMSGTETAAPCSGVGPVMMALRPSTAIRAPILASSPTWRKRFSYSNSLMMLIPFAWVISAPNWGWRSVAKPGWGQVVTSTARSGPPTTRTWRPPSTTVDPAACSLLMRGRRSEGRIPSTTTVPPVAAAAVM